jgi:hypothetical protein
VQIVYATVSMSKEIVMIENYCTAGYILSQGLLQHTQRMSFGVSLGLLQDNRYASYFSFDLINDGNPLYHDFYTTDNIACLECPPEMLTPQVHLISLPTYELMLFDTCNMYVLFLFMQRILDRILFACDRIIICGFCNISLSR